MERTKDGEVRILMEKDLKWMLKRLRVGIKSTSVLFSFYILREQQGQPDDLVSH